MYHASKDETTFSGFSPTANAVTVGRLSNVMSADHEDVYIPVKKVKPKSEKVVVFWDTQTNGRKRHAPLSLRDS